MEKSKPMLYALWECVDHIEVPYVDRQYSKLINIIYQCEKYYEFQIFIHK